MSDSLLPLLHPRYWLVWIGAGLTSCLCFIPWRLRDRLAAILARIAYRPGSKQINIARINLGLCYPGWSADETEHFLRLYFTRYIQVLVQVPYIWWNSRRAFWRKMEVRGLEHLLRERDAGHPIILLFNHSMAVDFGAVALSTQFSMQGIYKPFDNAVIDWLFRRGRLRFGAEVSARGDELRSTLKSLREGKMLVYLCDEDFGAKGSVFAPFFGQQKATLAMLPRLARHSQCKVVPIYTHYDCASGKFIIDFWRAFENYPGNDEISNATTLNQVNEQMVSVCPEQYLWKLRFFRTREQGARSFYPRS